jgi:hypothetical protein
MPCPTGRITVGRTPGSKLPGYFHSSLRDKCANRLQDRIRKVGHDGTSFPLGGGIPHGTKVGFLWVIKPISLNARMESLSAQRELTLYSKIYPPTP